MGVTKAAFIQHKFHGPRQARNNPGEHKQPQNFAAPRQGAWGRQSITTNYNSNNSGPGRTQSLYHNAGASASHGQPNDITNPEDVLVVSKRTPCLVTLKICHLTISYRCYTTNWYSEKISFSKLDNHIF